MEAFKTDIQNDPGLADAVRKIKASMLVQEITERERIKAVLKNAGNGEGFSTARSLLYMLATFLLLAFAAIAVYNWPKTSVPPPVIQQAPAPATTQPKTTVPIAQTPAPPIAQTQTNIRKTPNCRAIARKNFERSKPVFSTPTQPDQPPTGFGAGSLMDNIEQAFNKGDYTEVLRLTPEEEVFMGDALYIRALSLYATHQYLDSERLLSDLLEKIESKTFAPKIWSVQDGEWFILLNQLARFGTIQTETKGALEKIMSDSTHEYHKQAHNLYEQIAPHKKQ